jgi:2-methylcitrate dehydratase PrpD
MIYSKYLFKPFEFLLNKGSRSTSWKKGKKFHAAAAVKGAMSAAKNLKKGFHAKSSRFLQSNIKTDNVGLLNPQITRQPVS